MIDQALIEELKAKLKRSADVAYFFSKLDSAEWALPLSAAGFFADPPALERVDDSIQAPPVPWPAGAYLARVAPERPEEIARIVEAVPDTDNPLVHRCFMEVLNAAPAEVVVRMLPRIKAWLHGPLAVLLEHPGTRLVQHLVAEDRVQEALDLLFDWLAPPGPANPEWLPWDPESFEFSSVLDDTVPSLIQADSAMTLTTLVRLLSSLMPEHDSLGGAMARRPAIEDNEQNLPPSGPEGLVVQVRDAAVAAVGGGTCPEQDQVLATLSQGEGVVFQRIAMHVLWRAPTPCPELLTRFLGNQALSDDVAVHHEYWLLARDRFGDLPDSVREQILSWIEAGPDLTGAREREEALTGTEVTDDDLRQMADHWRCRRLTLLKTWLSGEWLATYQGLLDAFGEFEHPEFLVWSSGVKTGPNSPVDDSRLMTMPLEQLLEFLRTWVPEEGFMLPSPEGLARSLQRVIAARHGELLPRAMEFAGLDPTYVRSVFDAVREALGKDVPLEGSEWAAVLDLGDWVLGQPRTVDEPVSYDRDSGWRNARASLVHILDRGIRGPAIPVSLSEQVWRQVSVLLLDPEPSPEFEAKYGGDNMDPDMLSINTIRGTAMHAAVACLLWRDREGPEDGLVLEAIEAHLDSARDPSAAVRSVVSGAFPSFLELEPAWARTHRDEIFPTDDQDQHLFDAAWGSYLRRWRPGRREFDVLHPQYTKAVAALTREHADSEPRWMRDMGTLLGQQLAWLVCVGAVELDDPLMEQFLSTAPSEVMSGSTEFVGRLFMRESRPDEATWARIRAWWTAARARDDASELAKFGWWVGAGELDPAWYLEQLTALLRQGVTLDGTYFLVEELERVAHERPSEVLACLQIMEESGNYPWLVLGHQDKIEAIVRSGLAGDAGAVQAAKRYVNLLAARASADLTYLLDQEPGS